MEPFFLDEKMNFYPFHIGDYRGATAHLTGGEDLAYRRLLDMYYDIESPLPNNIDFLARRIRASSEEIQTVLKDFFSLRADFWWHDRCEQEIEKFRKMSEGGKAGAAKRWAKASHSPPMAPINTPQCVPNANQEPRTINQEPRTKNQINNTSIDNGNFEEFWSVYDKKVDKPATLKAWNRARIDSEALPSVLKAASRYVVATPDKKYRKNPATWLNGRCWNDEVVDQKKIMPVLMSDVGMQTAANAIAARELIFGVQS